MEKELGWRARGVAVVRQWQLAERVDPHSHGVDKTREGYPWSK